MKISLFGKTLFSHNKSKVLYDFAQHGLLNGRSQGDLGYLNYAAEVLSPADKKKKKALEKKAKKTEISPKSLFKLGSLNDNDFVINADHNYLKAECAIIERKLKLIYGDGGGGLIHLSGGDYSKLELKSMLTRLNARLKIKSSECKEVLADYPHTSSALINDVVAKHDNLRCKIVTEFVSDMPEEAVDAMTKYNAMCVELTGLKTNFYVVADKKDFGEIDRKRDPILLAQSPFGFFWQILGAWDEEMVFLGDL